MGGIVAVRFVDLPLTMARRGAVKLWIPALVVAVLAVIALWRVGPPPGRAAVVGTTGSSPEKVLGEPIKTAGELLSKNTVGREASLEHVQVRELVGNRALWIGSGEDHPVFAVLDPDVKRDGRAELRAGARVTLVGIVRPAPKAADAERQWHVPAAQAELVEQSGTYLHVTEVKE
jgi:hypothetical protein